jgi:adenylate cyclase
MNKQITTILTFFGGTILFLFIYMLPVVQSGDLVMRNHLFEVRGVSDLSHSDIVIVEMSSRAEDEIPYKYPWPTYVYAKLVENLNMAGARVIAFDVIFNQPDMYDLKNDSLFASAVEDAGNVIFAGRVRQDPARHLSDGIIATQRVPLFPRQLFLDATPWGVGFIDMRLDRDGFIRTYPLQFDYLGQSYHSLALQILPVLYGDNIVLQDRGERYDAGGRLIPKNDQSRMLINFYGGYRSFDYISMESVVDDHEFQTTTELEAFEVNEFDHPDYGLLHRGVLKDKIVLVGATMPELQDFHQVPFSDESGEFTMAGVEIHAHALQTILDESFLRDLKPFHRVLLSLLLLGIAFIAGHNLLGWSGVLSVLVLLAGWSIASVMVFINLGLFLPVLPGLLAIALGYVSSISLNIVYEMREKLKIKSMFSSYVSPKLVEKMISDEIEYKLGGSVEELTVLFTDIEQFTMYSESEEPEKMVSVMNRYLNVISNIITRHDGTLDKYIGDAVMAFYGAPVPVENQAELACRTILEAEEEWSKINYEIEGIPLRTRYGVNTGKMLVGNMGSEHHFNYTVIGDQVNLAARCESACKVFGVYAIISASTKKRANAKSQFLFRELGRVRLKGRSEPETLYQLIGFNNRAGSDVVEAIFRFEDALQDFYNREFKKALHTFEDLKSIEPAVLGSFDKINPSLFYAQLCYRYLENPPPEEWDGEVDAFK